MGCNNLEKEIERLSFGKVEEGGGGGEEGREANKMMEGRRRGGDEEWDFPNEVQRERKG